MLLLPRHRKAIVVSLMMASVASLVAAEMNKAPPSFPSVPRMSWQQRDAMDINRARAVKASALATPKLLTLLDADETRAGLRRCCPNIANGYGRRKSSRNQKGEGRFSSY